MRFLIKLGLLIAVVFMIFPLAGGQKGASGPNTADAIVAARETISDLSSFCQRQPDVCRTGKAALQRAGVGAREGAKLAYDYLNERFGPNTATPDGTVTGSVTQKQR
jgi:hypothetical protein